MELKPPKVSICIPTYNQTVYLAKVLDTVFSQTFTDFEVIISDDSTTSDVKQLVDLYAGKTDKIKYFHHHQALGSPQNWNFSIQQAKGDYIKIMHHDDWFFDANSLSNFVKLITERSDINFAFSAAKVEFPSGKARIHSISHEQFELIKKKPATLFEANIIGGPSSVIFKREIGVLFDLHLKWLVDVEFYYEILKKGNKVAYSNQPLVVTFVAPERITNSCYMNKFVEVPEHLYFLNKHRLNYFSTYNYLINLFKSLDVKNEREIRLCGYNGRISKVFLILLFFKTSFLYKVYSKFINAI